MRSKGKNQLRSNLNISDRNHKSNSIPVKSSGIFSSNLVSGSKNNLDKDDLTKSN